MKKGGLKFNREGRACCCMVDSLTSMTMNPQARTKLGLEDGSTWYCRGRTASELGLFVDTIPVPREKGPLSQAINSIGGILSGRREIGPVPGQGLERT